MGFRECPRCGWNTLEKLKTHSHCVNCFYFPDEDPKPGRWPTEIDLQRAKRKNTKPVVIDQKIPAKSAA
ncbi:MAG: hypothetical protein HY537_14320 [Deltaproteobacteria bacterium]|nr:hypothetical protein [Deltaproteobacteria bacterium]